jgi:hypothetical protein
MSDAQKAYDLKELVAKLKGKGLNIAEDAAGEVYACLKEWLSESAVKSENKYDDLILAILPMLDELVEEQIDKIDGEEG